MRFFATCLPLSLLLTTCSTLMAQQERPQRPPEFSSVEVHEDRTVVFRVHAPDAERVTLSGSDLPNSNPFGPGLTMEKRDDGVWEVTTAAVPGGSSRYNFNIDGVSVIDPRNGSTSESNGNTWSLMHVPGSTVSDPKDVPHGAVSIWQYPSTTLNRPRRVHVYTPPGYEAGDARYPVLYLLHGAMDSDASWSTIGRAGVVLDNLIADGKAKPMIVVMPMGHTGPFTFGPGGSSLQDQMSQFQKDFVNDLRPAVESRYRIAEGRDNRAIAGLSMGGAQTLDIAIQDLDDYGYIGVFSSGVFGITGTGFGATGGPKWEDVHKDALDNEQLRQGLHLIWFATGKEDFLLQTSQETVNVLKSHGFDVTYTETEGGHTWINWREAYLPEFAQLLFR